MWVQITLLLFTPAVFTVPYYESFDDADKYQTEDMKSDSMQETDSPRDRRSGSLFTPATDMTIAPEDAEAIKGAINQFLGRNQPEYVAPTSPTRTPKPDQNPKPISTNITRTQKPGFSTPTTPTRSPNSFQERNASTTPTRTPISGRKGENTGPTPTITRSQEHIATDTTRTQSQDLQKMTVTPSRELNPDEKMSRSIVPSRSPKPSGEAPFGNYANSWTLYPFSPGRAFTRTRSRSYTERGQRADYTFLFEATKMPLRTHIAMVQTIAPMYPGRTVSGQNMQYMSAAPPSRSLGQVLREYMPRSSSELSGSYYYPTTTYRDALRLRTYKRTPSKSTRNTLCTDDDEYCKTMCFDKDKYRIPCPTTTTLPRINMNKLFSWLDVYLEDFDTNLTQRYNMSLLKSYRTCKPTIPATTTITTTAPSTPLYYDYETTNKTGALIAKCFVCGLELEGIPQNAHCSDAFAGEFLPLTPVDASARGHLAEYRKYCKYMNMLHWFVNGSDSRTIWGAWTGGCGVRWLDLSGVYTQRSCRNKHHPITGKHFVSKRMAKLEFALGAVDNGCIISPMASLVPFSRGVSLYARFHACVCTGNWCNRATTPRYGWLVLAPVLTILPHEYNPTRASF